MTRPILPDPVFAKAAARDPDAVRRLKNWLEGRARVVQSTRDPLYVTTEERRMRDVLGAVLSVWEW